jgi:hypothetical protein
MITIFAIPKPFKGHNNIIQRNALKSWLQLKPECEIFLFGDDEGVKETAEELGVINIPTIEKNEFGTPLVSSAFNYVQEIAFNDILIYANADIIFFQNIIDTIKNIKISPYLICGRRLNLDVKKEIDFDSIYWSEELLAKSIKKGKLHGFSGKDYFIFKKKTVNMLPFSVGRPGWDDWFLYHMRVQSIPIIDSTGSIKVIHQNHDYSHSKFGKKLRVSGPEWERNNSTIGSFTNILSLRDADWIIVKNKLVRHPFPSRLFNMLSYIYPWRLLLACKRRLHYILTRILYSKNIIKS